MKYTIEDFQEEMNVLGNEIIEMIPSAKYVYGINVNKEVILLISDIIHHTTGGNIEEGIKLLKEAENEFIEFNKELDQI